jgi:predicted MPP superfamily phosphohydrolase
MIDEWGVGGIEVPFRTWAPPDIVIVDVVAPGNDA